MGRPPAPAGSPAAASPAAPARRTTHDRAAAAGIVAAAERFGQQHAPARSGQTLDGGERLAAFLKQTEHGGAAARDRKSTRLNSSHLVISYAVFCVKKKT